METKAETKEDSKKIPAFFSPVAPSLLHETQFQIFLFQIHQYLAYLLKVF
jgi:hypothetical protein